MKVLFVFNTITPYFDSIFSRIVKQGIEVIVIIPNRKSGDNLGKGVKSIDHATEYKVIGDEEVKAYYGKMKFSNLINILKSESPDIVVFIWPYLLQLFFDNFLLRYIKKEKIKLVFKEIPFQVPPFLDFTYYKTNPVYNEDLKLISRGFYFYINTLCLMYIRRFLYSKIDGTLNYISSAKELLNTYGVGMDKIHITFNSSDSDALLKEKESIKDLPLLLPQKPRVLHIGRLVKWKRVDLLIDAHSYVLEKIPDAELLIVGDGPELERLKLKVKSMCLEESVRFVGAVYDSFTLGRYMIESSLYVLAGMGGLSINDAMTYSLPILCSVCDGTERDLVRDGVNGYFFEEGNEFDLAQKIVRLLENETLRKQFGKHSEMKICNEINVNTVVQNYINAFNQIYRQ